LPPDNKLSGCRKDKPAGSGLTKPICLSFSLLEASLIALTKCFEHLAAREQA
jgi:hypothetical protein